MYNNRRISSLKEKSIHSSSIWLIPFWVVGELEPVPADMGREAGYTLDELPEDHRAIER